MDLDRTNTNLSPITYAIPQTPKRKAMHHDDTDTAVLNIASDPALADRDRPRMPSNLSTGELSEVEKALAVLAVLDGDWQGE